jgi:hypothetical protein
VKKGQIRNLKKQKDEAERRAASLEEQAKGKSQFVQAHLLQQAANYRKQASSHKYTVDLLKG